MVQLTEDDIKFITENILEPVFLKYTEELAKQGDKSWDAEKAIFDSLATRIRELNYAETRNRMFMIAMFKELGIRNVDDVFDKYNRDFDRLNMHLLKDENPETFKP